MSGWKRIGGPSTLHTQVGRAGFSLDLAVLDAAQPGQAGAHSPNPGQPTGSTIPNRELRSLVQAIEIAQTSSSTQPPPPPSGGITRLAACRPQLLRPTSYVCARVECAGAIRRPSMEMERGQPTFQQWSRSRIASKQRDAQS